MQCGAGPWACSCAEAPSATTPPFVPPTCPGPLQLATSLVFNFIGLAIEGELRSGCRHWKTAPHVGLAGIRAAALHSHAGSLLTWHAAAAAFAAPHWNGVNKVLLVPSNLRQVPLLRVGQELRSLDQEAGLLLHSLLRAGRLAVSGMFVCRLCLSLPPEVPWCMSHVSRLASRRLSRWRRRPCAMAAGTAVRAVTPPH